MLKPGKVVIEQREIPSPASGQFLIKTICTLISTGTELTVLSGEFPKDSAWANLRHNELFFHLLADKELDISHLITL